jgi:hypothetical protein
MPLRLLLLMGALELTGTQGTREAETMAFTGFPGTAQP